MLGEKVESFSELLLNTLKDIKIWGIFIKGASI